MSIEGGSRNTEVQESEISRSVNEQLEQNREEAQRSGERLEARGSIEDETETTEIADDVQKVGPEVIESVKAFEQTNWDDMDLQERQEAINDLADSVAADLELENKPDIKYYQSDEPGDYGGYSAYENAIYINENQMDDAVETADTIAHESRHCWQHEYAERSDDPQAQEFRENFEDYIRPEDDYRGYRNQPVEVDAREYAESVTDNIPENRE